MMNDFYVFLMGLAFGLIAGPKLWDFIKSIFWMN